ncbi:hypothetical protein [Trabulsiella guamensis]|uniref:hypothetical protein n=1 Tax=Trabulsiella guamensis TaxID=158852 RepID=UPI00068B368A|nr:hypothetical protein [Trabulsiella guamensis]
MKTRARYISIISSHLAAIDTGYWHYVLYVTPDNSSFTSLTRLFDGIRMVTRKNVLVPFVGQSRTRFLLRALAALKQPVSESE